MSEEFNIEMIDPEWYREMLKLTLERYNIQFQMELNEYRKYKIIYNALGFEKARAVVKQYKENEKKFHELIEMFENYFRGKNVIFTPDYSAFSKWFYKLYCFSVNNDKLFELEDITEFHFKLFHEYKERLFNGGWSDEDEKRALKEKYSSGTDEKRMAVRVFIEEVFDDWEDIFIRKSDYEQFIFIATSFFNEETFNPPLCKIETKAGTMNKTALKIRKCRDEFRSSISMTKDAQLLEFMRCLEMYDNISEGEWGAGHRLYKELIKGEQKGYN